METPTPILPFWHIYPKLRFRALFRARKLLRLKPLNESQILWQISFEVSYWFYCPECILNVEISVLKKIVFEVR